MHAKSRIIGLLLVGLSMAVAWYFSGPVPGVRGGLSASDVLAIRRVIRLETTEPILRIQGDGVGTATVQTGRLGNGLEGRGHFYHVNLTASGWQIVGKEVWLSALPGRPAGTEYLGVPPSIHALPHHGPLR